MGSATLAYIALGASALGAATSVYGSIQQGQAAKAQADYQAAVARNNAVLASRAAADARSQGEVAAANRARQGAQLLGRQRATLASNGVLVDQGSALDLTSDTAGQNELDQLTIRNNAERQALGFEAQGMNYGSQAGLDTAAGSNAASAGYTRAFGSALSGAGSVASRWYDFSHQDVFGGDGMFNVPNHGA